MTNESKSEGEQKSYSEMSIERIKKILKQERQYETVADLLADVMHYCASTSSLADFEETIRLANAYVADEVAEESLEQNDHEVVVEGSDGAKKKIDSVYAERNRLAIAFARMALAAGFRAGKGVDPGKWPVVYVETPNGQVSWHIAESEADALECLPEYPGKWDGTYRAKDANWCVWDQEDVAQITSPPGDVFGRSASS